MLSMALATMLVPPMVVAYVPNWVENMPAYAASIDYAKITHINIAFENPTDDEGNLSYSSDDDILIKTAHERGVKVLVSIGGGSASGNRDLLKRYFYLLSPSRRAGFISKIADYLDKRGFDGIDVDIEGPSINGDYGLFIRQLGRALKPKGKLLTAALSKGYGGENVPDYCFESFDFLNIMAYDGAGPWAPNQPGQHSSLEFTKDNVDYWLKRGLPKSKAVVGVPFYGYGFGKDALGDEWAYAKILAKYPGAEKVDQIGETIWYNGIPTIKAKGKYVIDQGLAGAMIWSLNSDAAGDKSLLTALYSALHP